MRQKGVPGGPVGQVARYSEQTLARGLVDQRLLGHEPPKALSVMQTLARGLVDQS